MGTNLNEDILLWALSVVHQLETDSDLETVTAPEKYRSLAERGKQLLRSAGMLQD